MLGRKRKKRDGKTYSLNPKEQLDNKLSNQKIPEQFVVFFLIAAHELPAQKKKTLINICIKLGIKICHCNKS